MSIMIVDPVMAAKLDRAEDAVQICASDGRVLGYFSPAKPKKINLNPPITEEELLRIEAEGPGRTLPEILRDLEKKA